MYPLRRVEDENLYYYESNQDSDLTLIFTPGGFNPEIWRHQVKYFSRKIHTISFQPTSNNRGFEGEKRALANVLKQDQVENAVLVSNVLGNPVIQSFEDRENVMATVFTGMLKNYSLPTRLYSMGSKFLGAEPKLFKKMFFSSYADYKVVKQFLRDAEFPSYEIFKSFAKEYDIRTPVKPNLVIHSEEDRFSSLERVKKLENNSTSLIKRSGTFSFYEKPQEYNKALNDFLVSVDERIEERKIYESKKRNRSLSEFDKKVKAKR
ncbi:MAG: alpha/beta hydrolase [Nanohaloarchaea archaeon]|nr:alpha/beta hydrolase [Candidatus Nanohaloarchaea archaeon]